MLFACVEFQCFHGVMSRKGLFAVTATLGTAHSKNLMADNGISPEFCNEIQHWKWVGERVLSQHLETCTSWVLHDSHPKGKFTSDKNALM